MRRYRSWDSSQAITKYRELWLRLCDIFPLLMADMEQSEALANLTIGYETYRYKAVVDGDGYMVWMVSSSPNFWEKAILPILTGLCTIYEFRPFMCRHYPNGHSCPFPNCKLPGNKEKRKEEQRQIAEAPVVRKLRRGKRQYLPVFPEEK